MSPSIVRSNRPSMRRSMTRGRRGVHQSSGGGRTVRSSRSRPGPHRTSREVPRRSFRFRVRTVVNARGSATLAGGADGPRGRGCDVGSGRMSPSSPTCRTPPARSSLSDRGGGRLRHDRRGGGADLGAAAILPARPGPDGESRHWRRAIAVRRPSLAPKRLRPPRRASGASSSSATRTADGDEMEARGWGTMTARSTRASSRRTACRSSSSCGRHTRTTCRSSLTPR